MKRKLTIGLLLLLSAVTLASAASGPSLINYEGVLRDSMGNPLDGNFDMEFHFWSADVGGDNILVDRHVALDGLAVTVTQGQFSVLLGGGVVIDGAAPGNYVSLTDVFGDYGAVHLEIWVGPETLTPRIPVNSMGYALNASRVDGIPGSAILRKDTSDTFSGPMLDIAGDIQSSYFYDRDDPAYFLDASGDSHLAGISLHNGYLMMNRDGPDSNQSIYFYEDNSLNSEWLRWDDSADRFELSDEVAVDALLVEGTAGLEFGVNSTGQTAGGYFADINNTGTALLAYGNRGINATGTQYGGYFADSDHDGYAYVGYYDRGIEAYGGSYGGIFYDSNGSGYGIVGFGHWGGSFYGDTMGVRASDRNNGTLGYLAYSTSSTAGTGTKNFVQNHPYRDDQVIFYAAPEGNEVATYTRGSAKLVKGEARIALDETFAWVTNPDIGLTASLTSRTDGAQLHVAEITTSELVVRADAGTIDDAVFDYMVWGLRIGFEEVSVVQPKGEDDALIPSMVTHHQNHAARPELRQHVALDRYLAMNEATGRDASVDMSAATALRDAIGVFDPAIHRNDAHPETSPRQETRQASVAPESTSAPMSEFVAAALAPVESETHTAQEVIAKALEPTPRFPRLIVHEPVAAGELLAVDAEGKLRLALGEGDPGVVGVADEDSAVIDGDSLVAVAAHGIVQLKVDADLGSIRPGDLLVSSPTPGHAQRAHAALPGTVIAKALEPLTEGRGTIRVLVMPR